MIEFLSRLIRQSKTPVFLIVDVRSHLRSTQKPLRIVKNFF